MIGFLVIAGLLCALTLLALGMPLWRGAALGEVPDTELAIYRDQLAEVDRDLARGVLDPAEAERTRTEISRRLLAADASARAAGGDAPPRLSRSLSVVMALAIVGTTGGLYAWLGAPGYGDVPRELRLSVGEERRLSRPSQAEAEAQLPIPDPLDQFDAETRDLILARRAAPIERPEDVDAWSVLAQTEAAIGQYHNAARATEALIALKQDTADTPVEIADYVQLVDLLVAGTQGYVSPQAEAIAFTLLQEAPQNAAGLYYAGLMYAQNDRPDRAFALWRQVIENTPQGSLHWDFAARQITSVAAQLGVDYALPDQRGPTIEDLEAAQDMPVEDRRAMIESMVGSLADRLATDGGPATDWARLITSLVVIDQREAAMNVLTEAETIFGGDVQAVTLIREAARGSGLIE